MPFMDGVSTIRALRNVTPSIKIISVSGLAEAKAVRAARALADAFLTKPYTAKQLLKALVRVLRLP